ncbi:MAG: LysR family transcriptional regulator [Eggerthellaceae bacterium]|nr:LysR family transcriptional regulator [Eggerthellaceae bacterium]
MVESWDWLIQLVETGSFTHAAEKLHISQQTLSARLAALEKELDAKLVVRSSPIALTRAGEAFMSYAHEQNEAYLTMMRRIGDATVGGAGNLKVGISNIRSRVIMPHVIKQFNRSMPGVGIRIIEGTNEELVRLAEQASADVVVARFGGTHPGVTVRRLYREEIVLALSEELIRKAVGAPAAEAVRRIGEEGLSVLRDCPFLLTSLDDITGRVARSELRAARIKPNVAVEADSLATLLSLCVAGVGAVFCPANVLDLNTDITRDLVRVHLSEAASHDISLGVPSDAEPWTPVQLFEDIVGALFGDAPAPGEEE